MTMRSAHAEWTGTLKDGHGNMILGSGAWEGPFSFASRFEDGPGSNPEELLGAAHAGCFSMFLSAVLTKAGFEPRRIHTLAKVHLGAGPEITLIELEMEAEVPGISEEDFLAHAETAKAGCPVSKALAGPTVTLKAKLQA